MSPLVALAVLVAVFAPSEQRHLGVMDLQAIVDQLGDEILAHPNLNPVGSGLSGASGVHNLQEADGDDGEEDMIPHPVRIHNWGGAHLHGMGQISGVAVNPNDEPVVFHRGPVVWDARYGFYSNSIAKTISYAVFGDFS